MSDAWEIYYTNVDDAPAAVLFDMGICSTVPDPDRPILLWMWLQLKSPTEDGFSTEEEEDKLTEIEDAFIDAVELTTQGLFVGRVTTAGQRQFYWYARSAEGFEDSIEEAMQAFDDYEYETGVQEDPDWQQYTDVLYPEPENMHQIHSRHMIDELEEKGDDLTLTRPVDHEASFVSNEGRAGFIKAAEKLGFGNFETAEDDQPEDGLAFAVRFQKSHAVDWETIDQVTFDLFEIADEHEGAYDGWEAAPAKK